jgi:hypothetical protein
VQLLNFTDQLYPHISKKYISGCRELIEEQLKNQL